MTLLHEVFKNNFEIIIPEFFFITALLISTLFGVFLMKKTLNNQKGFGLTTLNLLALFFLVLTLILTLNTQIITFTILNGIYVFDDLSKIVKIILLISTIFFFNIQYTFIYETKINRFEYIILIMISLLGLMLLISSYNLMLLYLSIELQSLCFYALASFQRKSVFSAEASIKYFIMGAVASGFILFGSSLIYLSTGSLDFSNIVVIFSNINHYYNIELIILALYGFFLIFIGLLFKIGSAPFHYWVPDVYEGSSNNITAFFSIIPKISIMSFIIKIFFDVISDVSFFYEPFFIFCSICSILIGSLVALKQTKIKRLLAYSSISHVGFMLISISANSYNSIKFILFYLFIYILMIINFWAILLSIKLKKKPIKFLTDFNNLFDINPIISLILMLNLFSMAGIPPLAGFFSKMFIFITALNSNLYGLVILGVLLSIVSTFYYIRIIKIIYFDKSIKNYFFSSISNINSIILSINIQIIILFFLVPDYILIFFEKISLNFLL